MTTDEPAKWLMQRKCDRFFFYFIFLSPSQTQKINSSALTAV